MDVRRLSRFRKLESSINLGRNFGCGAVAERRASATIKQTFQSFFELAHVFVTL